ncbi:MAG TPA: hypothetical protein VHO70_22925 [Chitinispirillaceae bacterium]|nr:hypothetical protein [Chitinispirillaceae bacterium]
MPIKITGCILVAVVSIFADLQNVVRDHFEWGEYSALIDTLAPIIDSLSTVTDSSRISTYHCYLGVAFFSTEKIGDARAHFLQALQFDSSIVLPSEYVSKEISALFKVIKSEFEKQQRLKFMEDSLTFVHDEEKKLLHTKKILHELENKHHRFLAASISTSTVAAVFLGFSIFQYDKSKTVCSKFKYAAKIGDQVQYSTLRNELKHSNSLILTFDIASGVTFCSGLLTAVKARQTRKQLFGIELQHE